jgi:hypothetical protein
MLFKDLPSIFSSTGLLLCFHFSNRLKLLFILAGMILLGSTLVAQESGEIFPKDDNQWHLLYTVTSFETTGKSMLVSEQLPDSSPKNPYEITKEFTDPNHKIVLQTPPVDCFNTGPASTNACTFTSSSATQEDEHTIRYVFRNWGGRCLMSVRLLVFAMTAKPHWSELFPWSEGSTFIVTVPTLATSATVFGRLKGENIFFTPQDSLSQTDAKRFTLLDKKVINDFGTIYRFKVN